MPLRHCETLPSAEKPKAAQNKLAELIKEVNLKEHEADVVEANAAAAYVFTNGEDSTAWLPCTCIVSCNVLTMLPMLVRKQRTPFCQYSIAERGIDSKEV